MLVQTITMDPRVAAIHFKDYRKKVREHRTQRINAAKAEITDGNKKRVQAYKQISTIEKEDTILMESYRAMVKGMRIVNVATALRDAGLDAKAGFLPKLAIARANWKHCRLIQDGNNIVFSPESYAWWDSRARKYKNGAIGFEPQFFKAELTNSAWRRTNNHPQLNAHRVQALVPAIPVHLRPVGDLGEFFVLWEPVWEHKAPEDPLLLRHIIGSMYSVLAQWDLTPLEQSVLEGRIG